MLKLSISRYVRSSSFLCNGAGKRQGQEDEEQAAIGSHPETNMSSTEILGRMVQKSTFHTGRGVQTSVESG